jgi:hypothetical protein
MGYRGIRSFDDDAWAFHNFFISWQGIFGKGLMLESGESSTSVVAGAETELGYVRAPALTWNELAGITTQQNSSKQGSVAPRHVTNDITNSSLESILYFHDIETRLSGRIC